MTSPGATAIAHPNVALSKYWGKRAGSGGASHFPAVPSLSVTLSGLTTRTRVRWTREGSSDRVVLNGRELDGAAAARARDLLGRIRDAAGTREWAHVDTTNDFPTASGLASSASGFAALARAAVHAAGDWDADRVSDLARRSSVSAARSVFGGFVELDAGPSAPGPGDTLAARQLAGADHLPLVVLVCVTTEGAKARSSTDGMQETLQRSPYAGAWLAGAPGIHADLRAALLARDFERVGTLAEASALAMHASAIAAGVVYWNGATLAAMTAVHDLRRAGVAAYFTIDAGPHVKVLVLRPDAARARAAMEATPGVLRVIEATPGEGARLESAATAGKVEREGGNG